MIFLQKPLRTILLYIIKGLHVLQSAVLLVGPYITNNYILLSILIAGYMLLMTFWYLYGHCICTPLEQYLEKVDDAEVSKYEDGNLKSFISVYLEKYLGGEKIVFYTVTWIPVINMAISLFKLNYIIYLQQAALVV